MLSAADAGLVTSTHKPLQLTRGAIAALWSADVIERARAYVNCVKERELDLRGMCRRMTSCPCVAACGVCFTCVASRPAGFEFLLDVLRWRVFGAPVRRCWTARLQDSRD